MNQSTWRPQFKIAHILIAMLVCAVGLRLVLADREIREIATFVLGGVSGSLIVTGIIYGRRLARAFFIGAAVPYGFVTLIFLFDRFEDEVILPTLGISLAGGICSVLLVWWLTFDLEKSDPQEK